MTSILLDRGGTRHRRRPLVEGVVDVEEMAPEINRRRLLVRRRHDTQISIPPASKGLQPLPTGIKGLQPLPAANEDLQPIPPPGEVSPPSDTLPRPVEERNKSVPPAPVEAGGAKSERTVEELLERRFRTAVHHERELLAAGGGGTSDTSERGGAETKRQWSRRRREQRRQRKDGRGGGGVNKRSPRVSEDERQRLWSLERQYDRLLLDRDGQQDEKGPGRGWMWTLEQRYARMQLDRQQRTEADGGTPRTPSGARTPTGVPRSAGVDASTSTRGLARGDLQNRKSRPPKMKKKKRATYKYMNL